MFGSRKLAVWLIPVVVVASSLISATPAMALPDQRVAYGFSEAAGTAVADSSANGTNATATSPTWTAAGRYGSALLYNGTTSRVRSNSDISLNGAFTLQAWVFNPSNQARETVVTVGPNGGLFLANGVLSLATGLIDLTFGPALPTNTWQYVTVVSSGLTVRAFVGGVQRGTTKLALMLGVNGPVQVGARISGSANVDYFNGTVDEVRVYNRALSTAEITTDMNAPVSSGGGDTTAPVVSGALPTGTLPAGTTQANLQVTTSEPAICRFGTVAGTAYPAIPNTFASTGTTAHSSPVTGLTNGSSYVVYVRCQDSFGNATTADATISFSVATSGGPGWSTTTSLPLPRSTNGAVYANGYMYLVGGLDGTGAVVPTVYYAPVNANGTIGTWNTTTAYPTAVRSVRPVFSNGYLYVAGGSDGNENFSAVYYAAVNANGTLGPWTSTSAMPQSQLSHSTVAVNGYLYTVGGNPGTCVTTVRYAVINANGSLGSWNATSALPGARCGIVEAATAGNGYMYLVGGYDNNDLVTTVLYAQINANGTLGAWQTNANPSGTAREYHGVEVANGSLYVIAGQAALFGNITAAVERATINANGSVGAFSPFASLPAARGYLATETVNGYLYALGGGTGISGGDPQPSVYFTAATAGAPPDSTPAVLSGGAPTGTLPAGTTQATVAATTNESATCRYSTTPGTPYASMTGLFSITGATGHSTTVTGLSGGQSYTFNVRCIDGAGNANTTDYAITFTIAAGGDPTPPVVSITAPAGGATVSGAITVTANATDNVGVAGVQFLLDGANLGSEDTTAPYDISWNTTTAANGSHTLTARARDAANQTTSDPVTVTVSNTFSDPRLAYALNEGTGTVVDDASGNNTDATAINATWTASGQYGNAIVLDGAGGRVRSDSDITLTSAFTLEAWVLNPTNGTFETIMCVGQLRNLYLADGVLTFFNGAVNTAFGPALDTGMFQHVAIVSDGSTVSAYVDGVQLGATQNVSTGVTTAPVQLGAWIFGSGNADYFSGTIDEVRVYNRALSATEIQADMAMPIGPGAP